MAISIVGDCGNHETLYVEKKNDSINTSYEPNYSNINDFWKKNIIFRSNNLLTRLKQNNIPRTHFEVMPLDCLLDSLNHVIYLKNLPEPQTINQTKYQEEHVKCITRIIKLLSDVEELNYDYFVIKKENVAPKIKQPYNAENIAIQDSPLATYCIIKHTYDALQSK